MESLTNIVRLRQPDAIDDPLTEVLRAGARRLLAQAVELEAEVFLAAMQDLRLPNGWHASPDCIEDRTLATGEALTEAAARAARTVRANAARPTAPTAPSSTNAEPGAGAVTEDNDRLRAENAGLIADLVGGNRLATVEGEKAQALECFASLAAEIDQMRTVARDSSGPETEPAADASPPVQSGQPARTYVEARAAVLVLLKEDLTDWEFAQRVGASPTTVANISKQSA